MKNKTIFILIFVLLVIWFCAYSTLFTGALFIISKTASNENITRDEHDDSSININKGYLYDESGVKIKWVLDKESEMNFPDSDITMKKIAKEDIRSTVEAVQYAIRKYPEGFVKQEVDTVYILGNLNIDGADCGGSFDRRKMYLVNAGSREGYTKDFIVDTFYHEFSHILYYKYDHYFNSSAWEQINPSNFKYGGGGVEAIKNDQADLDYETALLKQGFINEYAKSGIEEDFAELNASLLSRPDKLFEIVNDYPRMSKKVRIIEEFYFKLDKRFTHEYFFGEYEFNEDLQEDTIDHSQLLLKYKMNYYLSTR